MSYYFTSFDDFGPNQLIKLKNESVNLTVSYNVANLIWFDQKRG